MYFRSQYENYKFNIVRNSNLYLVSLVLVAILGGLLFGYDTAVISGAEQALQKHLGLNAFWHGVTASSALIGCVIGGAISGVCASRMGRRNSLRLSAVLLFLSALGSYYPEFIFLFNTGVRIGELAGLTWDNVDFKNNMLTIDKTVNRYRKKDFGFTMALASPKSRTSVRTIPMNNEVRKMLLKEKMRNAGPTMSIPFVDDSGNIRRQVSDIVFANSVGRVWNEPGKTKRWQIREVLILRRITQDKTR